MKHKIVIGIPTWGQQSSEFWQPAMMEVSQLYKFNVDLLDVFVPKSMSVDYNRNKAVSLLRQTKADWIAWIDADNGNPITWIPRLLEICTSGNRLMAGGIYFRRDLGKPTPIAYLRQEHDGRYKTIPGYRKGEIIPVDAGGMNCTLIHRSVFDLIERNFEQYITSWGAKWVIHMDDIQGMVLDDAHDVTDNQLIDGQFRIRMRQLPHNPESKEEFPFFRQEFNRTEDFPFWENAKRVGIQHWIDTSIECAHYAEVGVDGSHYQEWINEQIKKGEWKDG